MANHTTYRWKHSAFFVSMLTRKIGLIGAGRMATALARGFVQAQMVRPEAILASDPSEAARNSFADQLRGATIVDENRPVASQADVVFLAVKPQKMSEALDEIRDALRQSSLVVSIAAGVTLKRLASGLPAGQRIIRVMPNTPCLIGEGTSAYSLGESATADDGRVVAELLSAVGVANEVPEAMLDAVTGLSGSGPAFVYSMIEALAAGGVAAGLPAELAGEMAARTVVGAARMVIETGEPPSVLRDRVTSPGGTTLAGLAVLQDRGFNDTVSAAVVAAAKRSTELGQSSG
jgi:pyrroline-5-carboxylate reductase